MKQSLGILVSSIRHFDYVMELTRAAHSKNKAVKLFLAGNGVLLMDYPKFNQLTGLAEITICQRSMEAFGFNGLGLSVTVGDEATHAELVKACDRYIVL